VSEPQSLSKPSKRTHVAATIGISCLFAAVVRILAELVWFQLRSPSELSSAKVTVYLVGALAAAVFCWASVVALWFGRARLSIAIAAGTILILLAIKAWAVRAGVP
jgi:hypothetical protein